MSKFYIRTNDERRAVEIDDEGYVHIVNILGETRFDETSILFASCTNTLKDSAMRRVEGVAARNGLRVISPGTMYC